MNVIPPSASMGASVRTLSAESTRTFPEYAGTLAESVAAGFGCTAEVSWMTQYPPTVNDREQARFAHDTLTRLFGADRLFQAEDPLMGSEDLSFVLDEVPGAFYFLFATPEGIDPETAAMNHSPHVRFDDAVLADQAASLAALAWEHNVRRASALAGSQS